jgi:hypothetical protein
MNSHAWHYYIITFFVIANPARQWQALSLAAAATVTVSYTTTALDGHGHRPSHCHIGGGCHLNLTRGLGQ